MALVYSIILYIFSMETGAFLRHLSMNKVLNEYTGMEKYALSH